MASGILAPGFGDNFVLTLMTDCPDSASRAAAAGIDRIGVDLESIGKQKRQEGLNSRVSSHSMEDLINVREAIGEHPLFVRLNGIHDGSAQEIETVLGIGASHIMLPYFHTVDEAERFADIVAGRATTTLLVETGAAAYYIEDLVKVPGIDEIHIGLTDFKISLKIPSRFETLTNWMMDRMAEIVNDAGVPFHVGGVTGLRDPAMPIPGALVAAQYPRIRATGALVTRAFIQAAPTKEELTREVSYLRQYLNEAAGWEPQQWESKRQELKQFIRDQLAKGHAMP